MNRLFFMMLLLLAACTGAVQTAPVHEPIEVRTWLDGRPSQSVGIIVVQIDAESGLPVDLPEPQVKGLELLEIDDLRRERVGDRTITTRRYRFTGEPGTYEVPAVVAKAQTPDGEVQGTSAPLWIALDLKDDPLADLADIDEPSRIWSLDTIQMLQIGVALLCALSTFAVITIALRFLFGGRKPRKLPPEPPDVVALRAWSAVRVDADLDDLDKAQALASIFRTYTEAVLLFPATAWTTTEILKHLETMPHLADGNAGRARRLLRATDRIKFADASARATLFDELDDALRTFVGSTRPHAWQGDT
ncbi:MAG: hypothetical protein ACI9MC_003608 [Kiritimatiellia bacterium]